MAVFGRRYPVAPILWDPWRFVADVVPVDGPPVVAVGRSPAAVSRPRSTVVAGWLLDVPATGVLDDEHQSQLAQPFESLRYVGGMNVNHFTEGGVFGEATETRFAGLWSGQVGDN